RSGAHSGLLHVATRVPERSETPLANASAAFDYSIRHFANGRAVPDYIIRHFANGRAVPDYMVRLFANGRAVLDYSCLHLAVGRAVPGAVGDEWPETCKQRRSD